MLKHLLTIAAAAAVGLSASAVVVEDAFVDYSAMSSFPYYVMDYTPEFADGVMKSSNPGGWY